MLQARETLPRARRGNPCGQVRVPPFTALCVEIRGEMRTGEATARPTKIPKEGAPAQGKAEGGARSAHYRGFWRPEGSKGAISAPFERALRGGPHAWGCRPPPRFCVLGRFRLRVSPSSYGAHSFGPASFGKRRPSLTPQKCQRRQSGASGR